MPDVPLKGEFVLNPDKSGATPTPVAPPTEAAATPTTPPVAASTAAPSAQLLIHNHEHSKAKFYSSMALYPENFTFQNQEADEEVVLLIRRDFITNVPWIIAILLLFLAPPVILVLGPIFFPAIQIAPTILTLMISFYYLVVFGFALLNYAIWYFNVGIVTTKRAIDIDVPNILVKMISEARLPSIVDVSYTQVGGIRSFFDYGDIFLQTEGIHQNIEFDRAPNPNMIRKIIGELLVDKPV